MKNFIYLFFLFLLQGCYQSTGTAYFDHKTYKETTSHDMLNAAKMVFTADGNQDFTIDTYRYELNITKPRAIGTPLVGIDLFTEHYIFKVVQESNDSLEVSLHIMISKDANNTIYTEVGKDDEIYKIIWNRIDYALNKNEKLDACKMAIPMSVPGIVRLNKDFACYAEKEKFRELDVDSF